MYQMIFCSYFQSKRAARMCLLSWIISIVLTLFGIWSGCEDGVFDFDKYCWFQGEIWNIIYCVVFCILYLLGIGIIIFIFIKIDNKRWKDNRVNLCLLFSSYLIMLINFVDYLIGISGDNYEEDWFNLFVKFTESFVIVILACIYRNYLPGCMTCSVKVRTIDIEQIETDESWDNSFVGIKEK